MSVRTVLGDIDASELGATYTHEHLITAPAPRLRDGDDLLLDDEDRAVEALAHFTLAGGGALVECTAREFGRNASALRRVSDRSGVHLVAVTGHVCEEYWQGVVDVDAMSEDALVAEMVRDLTVGMDGTDVRAGVIKCGSSRDDVTPAEQRVIRAAARAQQQTGAPITTHTTAGTMALRQLEMLLEAGADPRRVCLGHLDRRLERATHAQLLESGVFLGYDCMSKDWYESDADRVALLAAFVADGHGDQLLVAGDLARRSQLTSWGGGPGYVHILWRIVPWLRRAGVPEPAVQAILRHNPARFLSWG